jgi:hypothetical protein
MYFDLTYYKGDLRWGAIGFVQSMISISCGACLGPEQGIGFLILLIIHSFSHSFFFSFFLFLFVVLFVVLWFD